MSFKQAIISGLFYYATFTGRASRSAFWYFVVFGFLCGLAAGILDFAFFHYKTVASNGAEVIVTPQRFGWIPTIALFIPNIAVTVRRLHDTNHSGWWVAANMAPYVLAGMTHSPIFILIGIITTFIMLFFMCKRGTNGDNRYGSDPLA